MLVPLLYGILVAVSCRLAWSNSHLRVVGLTLLLSFAVSNIVFQMHLKPSDRAGVYTMLEMFVIAAAYSAWLFLKHGRNGKLLWGIVAVSIASICANFAYAGLEHVTPGQKALYNWTTNICFGAECLLLALAGAQENGLLHMGANRFLPGAVRRWVHPRSHDAAGRREP